MSQRHFMHAYMGDLDRHSLLAVHHLLACAEARLDEIFNTYESGERDEKGKTRLERWQAAHTRGELHGFMYYSGGFYDEVHQYLRLADYVTSREEVEIEALLRGNAA